MTTGAHNLVVFCLERGVVEAWDRESTRTISPDVDARMALFAVHEVVTALRANPAWCRAVGIDTSDGG